MEEWAGEQVSLLPKLLVLELLVAPLKKLTKLQVSVVFWDGHKL